MGASVPPSQQIRIKKRPQRPLERLGCRSDKNATVRWVQPCTWSLSLATSIVRNMGPPTTLTPRMTALIAKVRADLDRLLAGNGTTDRVEAGDARLDHWMLTACVGITVGSRVIRQSYAGRKWIWGFRTSTFDLHASEQCVKGMQMEIAADKELQEKPGSWWKTKVSAAMARMGRCSTWAGPSASSADWSAATVEAARGRRAEAAPARGNSLATGAAARPGGRASVAAARVGAPFMSRFPAWDQCPSRRPAMGAAAGGREDASGAAGRASSAAGHAVAAAW